MKKMPKVGSKVIKKSAPLPPKIKKRMAKMPKGKQG
jgi:hypothetical protein